MPSWFKLGQPELNIKLGPFDRVDFCYHIQNYSLNPRIEPNSVGHLILADQGDIGFQIWCFELDN